MVSKFKINKIILVFFSVLLLYAPEIRILPHYTWILAVISVLLVCLKKRFAREYGIMSNCTYFIFGILLVDVLWSLIV